MKTIKITLVSIFLISTSLSVLSQDTINKYFSNKNELSIVIDDVFAKQEYNYPMFYTDQYGNLIGYSSFSDLETNKTMIGISYKRHLKKSALRSKLSFNKSKQETSDDNPYDTNEYTRNSSFVKFNFGWEWHVNFSRTQLFYGVDGMVSIDNAKYESTRTDINNSNNYESTDKVIGYGIEPLFGARIFITPNISFSSEIKFLVNYYSGSTEYTTSGTYYDYYEDYNFNHSEKNNISGNNFELGPLGQISINIHF